MTAPFSYGNDGIEFAIELGPYAKLSKHLLTLKSTGFIPKGIRISGNRLHEVMISNITLGQTSLTTTPFALTTVQSFKNYVDGRIAGTKMDQGDVLSFYLENRGNSTVKLTIFIDGNKFVPAKRNS